MREIEVDGGTIAEVVAYLNGHKTVPAKRMADAVLRLLNRHYQDAAALELADSDADLIATLERARAAEARAERLAEALREAKELIEELTGDSNYERWDDLLRDQEVDNG